ncbi:MAG: LptF/LptG family permease [Phycisphaerae bacterium]|nr:MAG: LptF/LptG family permease [Planctomycetota bacterium]MCK6464197.1 LptF/LptG family permease [Phycisphaerae bacterium]MCL4717629.1 LptF/LptG family permease [Phycisphaerae bacterium]MCQ3919674.1 hypothetical protein [Planctomycetota bacterium]NUQ08844.1 LptF/LptG family permease [Phycisphaerae bacterium]
MLKTLQFYVLREIGKTFLLTLAGLTAVLSMGGGVLNMIRLDEVSVEDLAHLMMLVLPVAATLTLPLATMYSAAATYGRLAADNELTACRGSGINLLRLLTPTIALAGLSATVTFGCLNFLIPSLVRNLDQIVGADIPALLKKRLNQPGRGLPGLGRYRLYTDAFDIPPAEGDVTRLVLTGVAFLEMGDEEVSRVGTAARVDFRIDRSSSVPQLSGDMWDTHFFDREANQFFSEQHQRIEPMNVPISLPPRIKFLNLPDLLHYRRHPSAWVEVREMIEAFRVLVGRDAAARALAASLEEGGTVRLDLPEMRYEVRVREGASPGSGVTRNEDGSLTMTAVEVIETVGGERRRITADRGTIEVTPAERLSDCRIRMDLYGDVRATSGDREARGAVPRDSYRLKPAALPAEVVRSTTAMSDETLLDPALTASLDPRVSRQQAALAEEISATGRKITGVIHQRLTFTVSVFVLALLAAGLGIVFSQSQLLVSVGISMIPGALVLVTILMGKQLTENAGTEAAGLAVMWGGLGLIAALDAYVLLRGVRR